MDQLMSIDLGHLFHGTFPLGGNPWVKPLLSGYELRSCSTFLYLVFPDRYIGRTWPMKRVFWVSINIILNMSSVNGDDDL